jgi:hypothetical protein
MVHDELVEKVARAIFENWSEMAEADLSVRSSSNPEDGSEPANWNKMDAEEREPWLSTARAALAVARPAIKEECARLCEECSLHDEDGVDWNTDPRVTLAAAIRAME